MDPIFNPFSPGAGRRPARLIGRDRQLELWTTALERAERRGSTQPLVITGLRGVGKTVLLAEMTRLTRRRGWAVARVEAHQCAGLRAALCEALHPALVERSLQHPSPMMLRALKTAVSFFEVALGHAATWAVGLDLSRVPGGGADTGILELDLARLLRELCAAEGEQGRGIALLLDEAQGLAPEELDALSGVFHRACQEEWPLVMAMAGLPNLPGLLARQKTYAERLYCFEEITFLDDDLARTLVQQTLADEQARLEPEALDLLVSTAGGSPYFLQQLGQEAWNEADDETITLEETRTGTERGLAMLDRGFFLVRWERASPTEQEYLRKMAQDGENGSLTSEVAARMGTTTKAIGTIRARLIEKGLIYPPSYGKVTFTVPGMGAFIDRLDAG